MTDLAEHDAFSGVARAAGWESRDGLGDEFGGAVVAPDFANATNDDAVVDDGAQIVL